MAGLTSSLRGNPTGSGMDAILLNQTSRERWVVHTGLRAAALGVVHTGLREAAVGLVLSLMKGCSSSA